MDEYGPSLDQTIALHKHEAERLFAGGVMIDDDLARLKCAWLEPEKIQDAPIREFWRLVRDGKDAAEAAMQVNSYFEIAGYMTKVPSSFDLPYYAQAISEDAYLLDSAIYLGDMARAIGKRDLTGLRVLAGCVASASPYTGEKIPDARQMHAEFVEMLHNTNSRVEMTYISNFDYATGGLEKQTLTIIGARPSMGKTSLASQIAQENAKHQRRVIYFSLEMSRASLWARMACGRLKVPWRDVLSRRVKTEQLKAIEAKSGELSEQFGEYLLIDDTSNLTSEDIYRKVSEFEPDLVIVDHLDLVDRMQRGKLREDLRVGNISRMGKIIAKELDIPAIYLMQLNRDTEHRDNKRPTLADLRNSGEVEQDADNVFFLYRKDYYDDPSSAPPIVSATEIISGKFRNGDRSLQIKEQYHLDEQWFYPEKRIP